MSTYFNFYNRVCSTIRRLISSFFILFYKKVKEKKGNTNFFVIVIMKGVDVMSMKREETLKMRELNLAKSLKDEGIPIDKIIKLTNLNKNQIMML